MSGSNTTNANPLFPMDLSSIFHAGVVGGMPGFQMPSIFGGNNGNIGIGHTGMVNTTSTTTTTTSSNAVVNDGPKASGASNVIPSPEGEDWAPTPLSEIRAKQLRKTMVNVGGESGGDQAGTTTTTIQQQYEGKQSLSSPSTKTNTNQSASSPVVSMPSQNNVTSSSSSMPTPTNIPQNHLASMNRPASAMSVNSNKSIQQQQQQQLQQHNAAMNNATTITGGDHPDAMSLSQQIRMFQMQLEQQKQQQPTSLPPHADHRIKREANQGDSGSVASSHHTNTQHEISSLRDNSGRNSVDTSDSTNNKYLQVPSTIMPPSVMTSVLPASSRKAGKSNDSSAASSSARSGNKKRVGNKSARVESPQDVLERILTERGYGSGSSVRCKAEETCYDFRPSPLQLASFGTELVKAIHNSDVDKLDELLGTGISPNPCNQFRDSIVDLVCKRGNAPIFGCLVMHGCDLRVCDGFGRTPLHHSCWASDFSTEIAEIILRTDRQQLLMEDKRGQTPLEYVRPDQSQDWIDFLEDHADLLFPKGGTLPPIVNVKALRKDGQIPDPPNCLPVSLAGAVSAGTISPKELAGMDPEIRAKFTQSSSS